MLAQEKVTKEKGTPPYGPGCAGVIRCAHPMGQPSAVTSLRYVSLLSSPLQGPAAKGHPWPIAALAASMPLNPLRGDSTRPPEGDLGGVCTTAVQEQKLRRHRSSFCANAAVSRPAPVRRPSVGVAQGDEPHGCGERLKGPGTALVSRPPERHRSEGSFA